jgi:hypothetical protein
LRLATSSLVTNFSQTMSITSRRHCPHATTNIQQIINPTLV